MKVNRRGARQRLIEHEIESALRVIKELRTAEEIDENRLKRMSFWRRWWELHTGHSRMKMMVRSAVILNEFRQAFIWSSVEDARTEI